MLEILQFVFSDFWIWLGFVILVSSLGTSCAAVILALRGKG